jgi:hypothetical protein
VSADIFTQIAVNDVRAHLRCGLMQQLIKFAELNIKGAMLDRDHTRAIAALIELRRIYVALDHVYPGDFFETEIKAMDAGMDRCIEAGRGRLLRLYVRTRDPEEVSELSETLGQIIARGGWDWQSEFDEALTEQMAS